jgi:hypothetical protein
MDSGSHSPYIGMTSATGDSTIIPQAATATHQSGLRYQCVRMLIDSEAEYSPRRTIILHPHLLWSKSERLTSSAEIHVEMLEIVSGFPRETALSHNKDTLLQHHFVAQQLCAIVLDGRKR